MGLEQNLHRALPGVVTSQLTTAVNWARKFSLFQYPFVTACCGMEYMATACNRYDISLRRRDSALLATAGGPPLGGWHGQPRLAPSSRASTTRSAIRSGWHLVRRVRLDGQLLRQLRYRQGIDKIIPVDGRISCPPRPEQVLDALIMLEEKIQREDWDEHYDKAPAMETVA